MSRLAGRPRVIANFALTADGKISTRNFTQTGFTSKADKRRLLEIRSLGDAVLAGAMTVSTDRMSMGIKSDDSTRAARLDRPLARAPARNRQQQGLNQSVLEGI